MADAKLNFKLKLRVIVLLGSNGYCHWQAGRLPASVDALSTGGLQVPTRKWADEKSVQSEPSWFIVLDCRAVNDVST
jgi:hypothetical protein